MTEEFKIRNKLQNNPAAPATAFSKNHFSFRSSETVSFLRPFALLLASTFRPFAVCIRLRNPWVVFLLLLCG